MTRTRTRSQSHLPKWSTNRPLALRSAILLMLPLMPCVSMLREAIEEVAGAGEAASREVKMVRDTEGNLQSGEKSISIEHNISDCGLRNSFS